MERIKNIEFLRFIFSLIIVCCHLPSGIINMFKNDVNLYKIMISNFHWTSLAVDFFFIISGFFLFMTAKFEQNFVTFAKKKLIRFMPTVLFMLTLYFIFSIFTPLSMARFENLFTILNLQNVGLTFRNGDVPASWFVSSLFWTLCFYFYLYKSVDRKIFNLITACIIFFCYSLWIHTNGINYLNVAYVFNRGMIRAFAGVGAGYFLAMIYKDNISAIKDKVLNIWQKLFCTGMEIYLFGFLIYYMCLHKTAYNNPMIMIISFIGLFSLFVIKKGYLSTMLENNFSVFLGQFAFAIFLSHQFVIKLWYFYVCKAHANWVIAHPILNLVLLFIVIILFGTGVHYCVERPVAKYFRIKKSNV